MGFHPCLNSTFFKLLTFLLCFKSWPWSVGETSQLWFSSDRNRALVAKLRTNFSLQIEFCSNHSYHRNNAAACNSNHQVELWYFLTCIITMQKQLLHHIPSTTIKVYKHCIEWIFGNVCRNDGISWCDQVPTFVHLSIAWIVNALHCHSFLQGQVVSVIGLMFFIRNVTGFRKI